MNLIEEFDLIDLTQTLTPEIPSWNGSCGYQVEIKKDYDRVFRVNQVKMHAGIGTHIDAPSHRFREGLDIADMPIQQFFAPVCVIDVRGQADADYEISHQDVKNYETLYGTIPPGAFVIGHTGWNRFWNTPEAYRNPDSTGQMHFPAFSSQAAELLLQRRVVGIGIDTLSPDCLNQDFPVHRLFLGEGKYIIENLPDCSLLPIQGAYIMALPIKAACCSEAPARVIGLISKSRKIHDR
jgi:kynurenine formamidase